MTGHLRDIITSIEVLARQRDEAQAQLAELRAAAREHRRVSSEWLRCSLAGEPLPKAAMAVATERLWRLLPPEASGG